MKLKTILILAVAFLGIMGVTVGVIALRNRQVGGVAEPVVVVPKASPSARSGVVRTAGTVTAQEARRIQEIKDQESRLPKDFNPETTWTAEYKAARDALQKKPLPTPTH